MLTPFPLSPTVSQAAIDLAPRLARAEPRVEGDFDEQGMSQGVEADRLVELAQLGRGSECRDGPAIGFKLAVPKESAQEGREPPLAVPGCRTAFRLAGNGAASLRPIVGRAHEKCRPR